MGFRGEGAQHLLVGGQKKISLTPLIITITTNQPKVKVVCPAGHVKLQSQTPATYPCLLGL